ncbi:hypothetical protein [Mycobacterium marinum]|uniref:hypothetical protein n=1 Tax=Mycobacterium marinum TaxID=1781 RepID=UPI003566353C
MAPLLTRGPEINLKRRTFLAITDNLGADPTAATTRSGLGGAARSAFFSSTSSSEISVAITDNDEVEIAMTAQDSNTTPNIGAQAPGQGAAPPPAPPAPPGHQQRRFSTGMLVGSGLLGLLVGAVGTAGAALFLWAFAFGPPPPPGPGGGGPSMGWHQAPPPGPGALRGPMPGGPPPMPVPPAGHAFRGGPPPGAPGPGQLPGAPKPPAPGQLPGGPQSPAPTPAPATPGAHA